MSCLYDYTDIKGIRDGISKKWAFEPIEISHGF